MSGKGPPDWTTVLGRAGRRRTAWPGTSWTPRRATDRATTGWCSAAGRPSRPGASSGPPAQARGPVRRIPAHAGYGIPHRRGDPGPRQRHHPRRQARPCLAGHDDDVIDHWIASLTSDEFDHILALLAKM